ncbi:hypothetical protein [Paracidovorax konjaci]|uniref:Uncharacterized protein n=1 Tax=Paracidovorax konjaci TaxID=32040 RepID=A0A1I1YJ70_9BURK|nr:hypothetical protein [Paracidovorax konjaci]SFE19541.1 hypothetical protein SAMN04489710_11841 [Paracidovorax konjaci]
MNLEITGTETAGQLIKQLVALRHFARRVIRGLDANHRHRTHFERCRDNAADGAMKASAMAELAEIDERELMLRSAEVEIGLYLLPLCDALDRKATRAQIFDAINTNPADRDTDLVRKYGEKSHRLICVLALENSASTRKDEWTEPLSQPLKWCHTMAFMREMTTNAKFDRAIHDEANEFFGGAFGEYRERPLMERLAGKAV